MEMKNLWKSKYLGDIFKAKTEKYDQKKLNYLINLECLCLD